MDTPEPLRALADRLGVARAAHDADAIAALYADDGVIILPDGSRLMGRAAIAAHYRALAPRSARDTARSGSVKFYFYPPLAHALSTVNGRHGEKHSFVDIFVAQKDATYLLACSSWTLR